MSPAFQTPLTGDHYDMINNGLRSIYDAQQMIAKASACGMDCRAHQESANYLQQQLQGLKTHFFPQGRPQ